MYASSQLSTYHTAQHRCMLSVSNWTLVLIISDHIVRTQWLYKPVVQHNSLNCNLDKSLRMRPVQKYKYSLALTHLILHPSFLSLSSIFPTSWFTTGGCMVVGSYLQTHWLSQTQNRCNGYILNFVNNLWWGRAATHESDQWTPSKDYCVIVSWNGFSPRQAGWLTFN